MWILCPLFLGQLSHFAPGGRQISHTWTVGGFQTGYVVCRLRHGAFSLSGPEEAMVTHDVCFSDEVRWLENVFDQLFCGKGWLKLVLLFQQVHTEIHGQ